MHAPIPYSSVIPFIPTEKHRRMASQLHSAVFFISLSMDQDNAILRMIHACSCTSFSDHLLLSFPRLLIPAAGVSVGQHVFRKGLASGTGNMSG